MISSYMDPSESDSSFEDQRTDRQIKKERNREKRREEKKAVLRESKLRPYYDEAQDFKNSVDYFKGIVNPTGLNGYLALNELISSTFHHARRRINLFPIIDRQPDYTLRCVFTGKILEDNEGNLIEKCD